MLFVPLLASRTAHPSSSTALRADAGPTGDRTHAASIRASRSAAAWRFTGIDDVAGVTTTTTVAPTTTTAAVKRATAAAVRVAAPRPKPATTTTTRPKPPPTTTTTAPLTHHQSGPASWYSAPAGDCAHQTLPMGTVLVVTNLANGKQTRCTVRTRGPFTGGRILDMSQASFGAIASTSSGVINVRIDWA